MTRSRFECSAAVFSAASWYVKDRAGLKAPALHLNPSVFQVFAEHRLGRVEAAVDYGNAQVVEGLLGFG